MIDGVNTYLASTLKNQKPGNSTLVSVVTFDDNIEHPLQAQLLDEKVTLAAEWVTPRGCTALRDGILQAIKTADELVACADNTVTADTVEVVIFTDGAENSSRNISQSALNSLIQEKTKLGYVFTFLAANQDAIATGAQYGIPEGRSMTCSGNREHQQATWSACSATPMKSSFSASIRQKTVSCADAARYTPQTAAAHAAGGSIFGGATTAVGSTMPSSMMQSWGSAAPCAPPRSPAKAGSRCVD